MTPEELEKHKSLLARMGMALPVTGFSSSAWKSLGCAPTRSNPNDR
jgi:hypothetical protein